MTADRLSIIVVDPEQRERLENRFWAKVDRSGGADACWEWTAACFKAGYGAIRLTIVGVTKWTETAHRVAYSLVYGQIPDGMYICHHCDNPPCCNPNHLFADTQAANVADMVAKGRHVTWAERHGRDEILAKIRAGRAKNPPKQTPENRERRAEAMRNRWSDPEWREKISRLADERARAPGKLSARYWLIRYLGEHGRSRASDVMRAAEEAGYSRSAIRQARFLDSQVQSWIAGAPKNSIWWIGTQEAATP